MFILNIDTSLIHAFAHDVFVHHILCTLHDMIYMCMAQLTVEKPNDYDNSLSDKKVTSYIWATIESSCFSMSYYNSWILASIKILTGTNYRSTHNLNINGHWYIDPLDTLPLRIKKKGEKNLKIFKADVLSNT